MTSKLRKHEGANGEVYYVFFCPGCDNLHLLYVVNPKGRPCWTFNGNLEAPSFQPSLLNNGPGHKYHDPAMPVCHLYVEAGNIKYLDDCTHALAGEIVPMVELE